ncbi:flagellar hook-length control protein FliK [Methylocucumis oryzae]|nr:flagellar hook-length control protein FliK [Methylocucumis oryzae]
MALEIQNPSAVHLASLAARNLSKLIAQLQPGYSLDAVVTAKLAENSFILRLAGGQELRAQTPTVLELGQTLRLEVIKTGTVPELKILTTADAEAVTPEQQTLTDTFKQLLPKQQSFADFSSALRQSTTLNLAQSDNLNSLLANLQRTLPNRQDLMTAEGVKQAINTSGIFLEAQLAAQHAFAPNDIKAQLLKLINGLQQAHRVDVILSQEGQVNPTPSDVIESALLNANIGNETDAKRLLTQAEGVLAGIVLDQLASLPKDNTTAQVWQLQLPFVDDEQNQSAKLKITKDSSQADAENNVNWSVLLELNPPGLGKLYSRISLIGDQIDTYFWSDHAEVSQLLQDNMDLLAARYSQAGLQPGHLQALEGVAPSISSLPKLDTPLIDERV